MLFIAADGSRDEKKGEAEKCKEVRKVAQLVDWPCEVKTLFRDKNLGCKIAVSSAINWFFENVEEGIILEDDCLPNQSFFKFCEELLERYRENEKIVCINGSNFQFGNKRGNASYYFSIYSNIWGWASWRRVWKNYDVNMNKLDDFKRSGKINKFMKHNKEREYWIKKFDAVKSGEINTWDYQLFFAFLIMDGVSVSPNSNMISNIGFGDQATHTNEESKISNIPLQKISKIKHPQKIRINYQADKYMFENIYGSPLPKWNDIARTYISSIIPVKVKELLKQLFN
ncbi:MAG: hypothetical protein POELPBGB_00113 [Bacteroidia bacterium]|nr:hypothetical protein [Bacteroidia bacterium]